MKTYIHSLVIERVTYDDTPANRDEYGQPAASTSLTEVKGLVQPKQASEVNDTRSAGSEVSDHVIFLPLSTDIRGADRILFGARTYNVTGVRRFEFGSLRHIEVDAELVTSTPVTVTVEAS